MTQYNIIDIIRSGADTGSIAALIGYGLSGNELFALALEYITSDKERRERIADLLTEINYHTERKCLERGDITELARLAGEM